MHSNLLVWYDNTSLGVYCINRLMLGQEKWRVSGRPSLVSFRTIYLVQFKSSKVSECSKSTCFSSLRFSSNMFASRSPAFLTACRSLPTSLRRNLSRWSRSASTSAPAHSPSSSDVPKSFKNGSILSLSNCCRVADATGAAIFHIRQP